MRFDIAIVGAGLAGSALAVALRSTRFSIALIDARAPQSSPEGWDARIYAVSPGSARFLREIGAWQHFDAARICAVAEMEIRGDRGARLDFSAYDSGVAELAWIVEAGLMQRELWETAKRQGNVTLYCPAQPQRVDLEPDRALLTLADGSSLEAGLLVGADGAESWVRRAAGLHAETLMYGEMGVVANFTCELPHRNTAFQWFRADGVLAWLPLPDNRISIVWSTPEAHARELLELAPEELCRRVAEAGAHRLGRLEPLTVAAAFPLRLMRVPKIVTPRVALIGDAAHTIHPLSGHGVNLGFADASALAGALAALGEFEDCGDLRPLRAYERMRAEEVALLQWTTHGLQRLFRPQHEIPAALRNLGMNLTNRLPVVRDALVRYALG